MCVGLRLKRCSLYLAWLLLVYAAAYLLSGLRTKFCMIPSIPGLISRARSLVDKSQVINLLETETIKRKSDVRRKPNIAN